MISKQSSSAFMLWCCVRSPEQGLLLASAPRSNVAADNNTHGRVLRAGNLQLNTSMHIARKGTGVPATILSYCKYWKGVGQAALCADILRI